jgi:hypothetical protein
MAVYLGGLLYMECQCLNWLQRCLQYDLEILLPYLALWIKTSQPVLFMEQEIVTLSDPLVTLLFFFLWELCCACFCSCLCYVHLLYLCAVVFLYLDCPLYIWTGVLYVRRTYKFHCSPTNSILFLTNSSLFPIHYDIITFWWFNTDNWKHNLLK